MVSPRYRSSTNPAHAITDAGINVPPGFSQRSRAVITGTSIPSSIPKPPSHSETITSTGSGSSMSSMSPWITWMMSATPLEAASSSAKTATVVRSTA